MLNCVEIFFDFTLMSISFRRENYCMMCITIIAHLNRRYVFIFPDVQHDICIAWADYHIHGDPVGVGFLVLLAMEAQTFLGVSRKTTRSAVVSTGWHSYHVHEHVRGYVKYSIEYTIRKLENILGVYADNNFIKGFIWVSNKYDGKIGFYRLVAI